ncbi:MAG: signal peptide peptidase SppA [Deltaproteobacteria bacterium]|nr:signal peptide peptidase SppA [Deltaproteobacteria bacterium]MBZ0219209.1 signal peptide peptidase SppA [Deltaproteobacteria bacterium]
MPKRSFLFLVFLLILVPGCVFITLPGPGPLSEKVVGGKGDDKVLLLDISGMLTDEKPGGVLGFETEPNLTARIREELELAAADPRVKAVVLRINTPGGSVTTSDIIAHEIKRFKEKKKVPIVAGLMDLATSGGYYIASSADRIIAQPTAVTGSIGVVALSVNASGLMEKLGITNQTVKSGDMKDLGSPIRPMTVEERRVLQAVIDGLFERFLDQVIEGRPGRFTREELRAISDGRILTASQALEHKLVDSIGYLDDAIEAAKEAAGIKEAKVVTYAAPRAYKHNIYSLAEPPKAGISIVNIDTGLTRRFGMEFMYVWMP